jgi:hypothetical protein
VYAHRIYGGDVDPYQAQQAIDNAVAAGEAIVLEHNLVIQNGTLNFKNADVRVNGTVTILNGVINVADARVSWAPGAEIVMNGEESAYILQRSQKAEAAGNVPDAFMVEFVERVQDIMSTSTKAAVRNFKLGPKQNHDYSQNSDGIDARVTNPHLEVLFVVDKLALPSEGSQLGAEGSPDGTSLEIWPLGIIDVTGTIPVGVFESGIVPGTSSTLTSSRGATITFIDSPIPTIPNVRVEEGRGITFLQAGIFGPVGPLTIGGKLTGQGPLTVVATDITVKGGDGNLIVTAGNDPAVGRRLLIYSTGQAVFTEDVTISRSSKIYSDVVFRGNAITVADSLELLGNVVLGHGPGQEDGQTITIAQGKTLTLGEDKIISLQVAPQKSTQVITAPLLTAAGGDVVLLAAGVAGGNVTLSTPSRPKDDPEDIAEARLITVGGSRFLEIFDGTLQVLPEAILTSGVSIRTNSNGFDKKFGYLAVAEGGTFDLDTTLVDSELRINGPVITGGNFTFTAIGGTITLGSGRIAGSTPGTKLSPTKGTNAHINVPPTGTLVLESIEHVVAAYSSIAINQTGKVTLDKGAKITLIAGDNGQPTKWTGITTGTNLTAQVTGAFVGLTPDAAAAKQPVWSVAHQGGELAEVNITAAATNATPVILGKTPKASFTR